MTVRVLRIDADTTLALRQVVLRPHQTIAELRLAGDDDAESAHFAAVVDGGVIAAASVRREAPPWAPAQGDAWRLRGMATAPEWRNVGVGARALACVIDHVATHGGGLLWCNARTPARSFYERAGFVARGDPWVDPVIGPHVAMERTVGSTLRSSDANQRQG